LDSNGRFKRKIVFFFVHDAHMPILKIVAPTTLLVILTTLGQCDFMPVNCANRGRFFFQNLPQKYKKWIKTGINRMEMEFNGLTLTCN